MLIPCLCYINDEIAPLPIIRILPWKKLSLFSSAMIHVSATKDESSNAFKFYSPVVRSSISVPVVRYTVVFSVTVPFIEFYSDNTN